jgi:hypothetical protein
VREGDGLSGYAAEAEEERGRVGPVVKKAD